MPPLQHIFSFLCAKQHNWLVGGAELPFCQRCTGMYVGAIAALVAYLLMKPKPSRRMLWTHGIFLLVMAPFGYHLVVQTGEIRMLTGQLFAAGLVYYLLLLPSDRWPGWHALLPAGIASYFALLVLGIILLQLAVTRGGPYTHTILTWLGFSGLLVYGMLVLLTLVLLAEAAWGLVRRRMRFTES